MEETGQREYDELLSQLVIRITAVENLLIKKGILTAEELAGATLETMAKLQVVIDNVAVTGFIKYGDQEGK